MNALEFNELVSTENAISVDMLSAKAADYANDTDRLDNFKCAAGAKGTNPCEALSGIVVKQMMAFLAMSKNPTAYSIDRWNEVLRDIRNYTYLQKANLVDLGVE